VIKKIQIDSVTIPKRHRKDIGDISEKSWLVRSIRDLGLLNPIMISPEGELLHGRRRLAACKVLGWPTIDAQIQDVSDD